MRKWKYIYPVSNPYVAVNEETRDAAKTECITMKTSLFHVKGGLTASLLDLESKVGMCNRLLL